MVGGQEGEMDRRQFIRKAILTGLGFSLDSFQMAGTYAAETPILGVARVLFQKVIGLW